MTFYTMGSWEREHTPSRAAAWGMLGSFTGARDRQEIRKPHNVKSLKIAASKHDSAPRSGGRNDPEEGGDRKLLG